MDSYDENQLREQLEQAEKDAEGFCKDLTRLRADLEEAKADAKTHRDAATYWMDGAKKLEAKLAAAEAARDEAKALAETTAVYWAKEVECVKHCHEAALAQAKAEAECHSANHDAALELLEAARRERDAARALIPIVCCNGADLNCYGPRGCLVRAQEANETEKDVLLRERDTHKARADAAEALLRGMGVERPAHPPSDEYYMDWRGRVFAHFRSFASPGATAEAEQARGGECESCGAEDLDALGACNQCGWSSSPSEGGAR